jgi:DNA-binding SARP family transcriptional activator
MGEQQRGPGRGGHASQKGRTRARGLFDRFPHGLLLVGERRRVVGLNDEAHKLLGLADREGDASDLTCCELVCVALGERLGLEAGSCLSELVLDRGEPVHDVAIDVGPGAGRSTGVSVTAARVDAEDVRVVFQLRPRSVSEEPGSLDAGSTAAAAPALRVETLGRFAVEVAGRPLGGEWLEQRPGQLLKYLVCTRHRVAASDQIAEALWPAAGPSEALTNLRHYVHVLREVLEPDRSGRAASSFIKTHRGGYRLTSESAWIDAEELERRAQPGLRSFAGGHPGSAKADLESAVGLYQGDFLPDERDAEWALEERERLHHLVARARAALVEIGLAAGDLSSAADHSRRLADMEPLDTEVQRQFIEICLRQGRRSDAMRRYRLLRTRTLREFGTEPDFTLSDLTA